MATGNSVVEIIEFPEKSENDAKEYRTIRLANGMKVMLVHDDKVHEDECGNYWPSCGLTVAVGSFSDPSDLPGLAKYVGKVSPGLSLIGFQYFRFIVFVYFQFSSYAVPQ